MVRHPRSAGLPDVRDRLLLFPRPTIAAWYLGQPRVFASRFFTDAANRVVARDVRRDVHHVAVAVGTRGRMVSAPMEHGLDASGDYGGRGFCVRVHPRIVS